MPDDRDLQLVSTVLSYLDSFPTQPGWRGGVVPVSSLFSVVFGYLSGSRVKDQGSWKLQQGALARALFAVLYAVLPGGISVVFVLQRAI